MRDGLIGRPAARYTGLGLRVYACRGERRTTALEKDAEFEKKKRAAPPAYTIQARKKRQIHRTDKQENKLKMKYSGALKETNIYIYKKRGSSTIEVVSISGLPIDLDWPPPPSAAADLSFFSYLCLPPLSLPLLHQLPLSAS